MHMIFLEDKLIIIGKKLVELGIAPSDDKSCD